MLITSLDNQNKDLLTTIDSLEAEISELTAEKNNLIIENTNYYNTISSLNNQIVNLQNVNTQLENTNTLHLNTISSLNTQIANLNQQISDITYQSQNHNSTISSLNGKIKELEESVQYYENYIASLENGNQVVATFEYDGSVYNIQMVNKGSTLAVATPTDTDYIIFNGWKVDGSFIDLSTYTITENTKIVADLTYRYDVIFKVDDANYNAQIVTNNDCPVMPENPTKTGYEFDGWSTDGVTVIENIQSKKITENTTYYAVFTKLHTVKFLYEDTTKSSQTIRNGVSATVVSVDNTTYKIFNGWKVNGSIVDVSTYKITSDTTFVADITYRYDVIYKVDDKAYSTQIITANNYPNLPTNPTKDGYEFEGWSLNGVDIINTSTLQITSNTTYYAVFSKLYKVTFVYEGTTISTQSIKENEKAKAVSVDNTAYKVFNGWKVNGEFVNISDYVITQDTTFVADITYKYDVVFKVDSTIHSSQIVAKDGYATLPNNPTKAGYEFDGWSLDGSTILTDIANTKVSASVTYYAVFSKLYSVKFVSQNSTIETQYIREGNYANNVVVENTQYIQFNGWKVNNVLVDVSTYEITTDTVFIADISYSYDVKFMVDESVYNSQIIAQGQKPTLPENPTKSGYEFDGWTLNGSIVSPEQIIVNETLTYTAKFTRLYTVTFVSDNATFGTVIVRENNYATFNEVPTLFGYDFVGWSLDKTNIVDISTIKITADTTFTAIYKQGSGLYVDGVMKKSWNELLTSEIVQVDGTTLTHNYQYKTPYSNYELRVPEGITAIGNGAFSSNENIIKIILPSTLKTIGSSAFANCKNLQNVDIPYGVETIGTKAFYFCYALTSMIIPDTVTSIGDYTFQACSALTSVRLSSSMTQIGDLFVNCYKLASVYIPYGITYISDSAFQECRALGTIYIPSSVVTINTTQDDGELDCCPFDGTLTTLRIYCGASAKPSGYEEGWDCYDYYYPTKKATVYWGYTYEQYLQAIGAY